MTITMAMSMSHAVTRHMKDEPKWHPRCCPYRHCGSIKRFANSTFSDLKILEGHEVDGIGNEIYEGYEVDGIGNEIHEGYEGAVVVISSRTFPSRVRKEFA